MIRHCSGSAARFDEWYIAHAVNLLADRRRRNPVIHMVEPLPADTHTAITPNLSNVEMMQRTEWDALFGEDYQT